MLEGSAFQTVWPWTGNARLPTVARPNVSSVRRLVEKDLSLCRPVRQQHESRHIAAGYYAGHITRLACPSACLPFVQARD